LNIHGEIAEDYAGNMRLFEATGVGTLLLTDSKRNLGDLFVPGEEVVSYRTAEECAELIRHYVERPGERDLIAAAGQRRALRDHTYRRRMEQLIEIIERHLPRPRSAD
jgi:spore maturation protein CgeB